MQAQFGYYTLCDHSAWRWLGAALSIHIRKKGYEIRFIIVSNSFPVASREWPQVETVLLAPIVAAAFYGGK